MNAQETAYALLSASGGIVGTCDDRVYPDYIPVDEPLPSIAIIRGDETEYITTIHSGTPVAALVPIEVWCMAASRADAEALADTALVPLCGSPGGFMPQGRRPEVRVVEGAPTTYASVLLLQFWE